MSILVGLGGLSRRGNSPVTGRLILLMREQDGSRWIVPLSIISTVAVIAAVLVTAASARGCRFESVCEDIPVGVACEAAGARLEAHGATLWGRGGADLTTPVSMSWGRDLFPLRKQTCTVTLDAQCRVTTVRHESWFTHGPSEYHMARLRRMLGRVLP